MADLVEIVPGVVFASVVLAQGYGRRAPEYSEKRLLGSPTTSERVKPDAAQPAPL